MAASAPRRPRVVLLRGHNANVWDLRPLEALADDFDLSVVVTGSNLHRLDGLGLPLVEVATPRDRLPSGRASGALAYVVGERYLGLGQHLANASIVHSAEIGTWFSAQAARQRDVLNFRLVVTVWETLPWRETYRWPRERAYRRAVLPKVDLFLAATDRARAALLLEDVAPERIEICPPGIGLGHFARGAKANGTDGIHTVLSAGRLVWEKGHQDVLRALSALRRGLVGAARDDVRLLIVGDGPEKRRLRRYAGELGLADHVEFRPTVPYDEMPDLYASATALVLASLPTRMWEEQFGMVVAEAMAAGTPVVACASGAIPEVLSQDGALVEPGNWRELAVALNDGPLSRPPGTRVKHDRRRLERFSAEAAAACVRNAYEQVLGR
jgi:glycosyltransferase involved in cell wall biosynthesis